VTEGSGEEEIGTTFAHCPILAVVSGQAVHLPLCKLGLQTLGVVLGLEPILI
jgi:hypothetical protein